LQNKIWHEFAWGICRLANHLKLLVNFAIPIGDKVHPFGLNAIFFYLLIKFGKRGKKAIKFGF
jgi:hypothetical protein